MIAIYDKDTRLVKRFVNCPDNEIIYNISLNEDYISVDSSVSNQVGRWKVENGALAAVPDAAVQPSYADLRRAAYPPVGDQLDAIWDAFAAMPADSVPEPARTMLQQITAVKEKYPAPPATP